MLCAMALGAQILPERSGIVMTEFAKDFPQYAFLVYVAIMSVITFMAYGIDKKKAIDGAWRTKEKTLLGLSLAGGAIGGLIGMKTFRHKTKHYYFWLVNYFAIALHIILFVWLAKGGTL